VIRELSLPRPPTACRPQPAERRAVTASPGAQTRRRAAGRGGGRGRTLRQLEQRLLAVDDAQRALRRPLADVARVEPAVLVQHLRGAAAAGRPGRARPRGRAARCATPAERAPWHGRRCAVRLVWCAQSGRPGGDTTCGRLALSAGKTDRMLPRSYSAPSSHVPDNSGTLRSDS